MAENLLESDELCAVTQNSGANMDAQPAENNFFERRKRRKITVSGGSILTRMKTRMIQIKERLRLRTPQLFKRSAQRSDEQTADCLAPSLSAQRVECVGSLAQSVLTQSSTRLDATAEKDKEFCESASSVLVKDTEEKLDGLVGQEETKPENTRNRELGEFSLSSESNKTETALIEDTDNTDFGKSTIQDTLAEEKDNSEIIVEEIEDGLFQYSFELLVKVWHSRKAKEVVKGIKTDFEIKFLFSREKKTNRMGKVTMRGNSREGVVNSYERFQQLRSTGKEQRPAFTHFVALHCANEEIVRSFKQFRSTVLRQYDHMHGICHEVFQKPIKLHVTVTMATLNTKDDVEKAVKLLNDCKNDFISLLLEGKPLSLRLNGLSHMKNNPTKERVLYSKVGAVTETNEHDSTEKLQNIVDYVYNQFFSNNLTRRQGDSVKLHCTLMNATYVERILRTRNAVFDASAILNDLNGFDFGLVNNVKLELVKLSEKDKDGFFKRETAITI